MFHSSLRRSAAILSLGILISSPATAQGDTCATAIPVTGTGAFAYDSTMSTSSGQGCIGSSDVFFLWTAPAAGDYLVELTWQGSQVPFDAVLGVYAAPHCLFTQGVGCNINAFGRGGVKIDNAVAAEEYLVQVSGWGGLIGTGFVNIVPAPCTAPNFVDDVFDDNDTIAQAVPVVAGTYTDLFVLDTDPDHFSVVIPPGKTLSISLQGEDHGLFIDMFHANGARIGPGFNGTGYDPQASIPTPLVIRISDTTGVFERDKCTFYDMTIGFTNSEPRFESFCNPPAPNSVGKATILKAWINAPQYGSRVVLGSYNGPPQQFGYYLVGSNVLDPGLPISMGQLCLTGTFARYNIAGTTRNSIGQYNINGTFDNLAFTGFFGYGFIPPDELPDPLGNIQAGSTWHFQVWHREPGGASHFSNGVSVQF